MNLDFLNNPSTVWFLIGIVLILSEFAVPGLVIIFFGAGACFTSLVLLFWVPPVILQAVIFLTTSIAALLLFRNKIKGTQEPAGSDNDFIGKTAVALNDFGVGEIGSVNLNGSSWKAVTSSDKTISKGSYVKVVGNESLTLIVEPAQTILGK